MNDTPDEPTNPPDPTEQTPPEPPTIILVIHSISNIEAHIDSTLGPTAIAGAAWLLEKMAEIELQEVLRQQQQRPRLFAPTMTGV
jgi:hypothetical protein